MSGTSRGFLNRVRLRLAGRNPEHTVRDSIDELVQQSADDSQDGAVPELDGVDARQSRFVDQQRTVPVEGLPGHRLRVARPAQAWADVAEDLALAVRLTS